MEYQEFLNKLQKRGSKPHKIGFCYGSRDAWKWVRKNKWKSLDGKPIDKLIYSHIIDEVHKAFIELIMDGHSIEFPFNMGCLRLGGLNTKVFHQNGELKTTYRTDWKKTLDLWYEDEEARNSHIPIKRIQSRIYCIRYYKNKANYYNKRFYTFRANRSFGKLIGREGGERKITAEPLDW